MTTTWPKWEISPALSEIVGGQPVKMVSRTIYLTAVFNRTRITQFQLKQVSSLIFAVILRADPIKHAP